MNGSLYDPVDAALAYSMQCHSGTYRDGDNPLPYLTHCVEVLVNLRTIGEVTDEDMLVAALLHDSLEENATTTEELESRFGKRATYFVMQMTRRDPDPAIAQALSKQDLAILRDNMLLEDIARMDPESWPIKLADRLSNLIQAKRLKSGKKLRRYLEHTESILKIIPKSANPGLWKAIRDELK